MKKRGCRWVCVVAGFKSWLTRRRLLEGPDGPEVLSVQPWRFDPREPGETGDSNAEDEYDMDEGDPREQGS